MRRTRNRSLSACLLAIGLVNVKKKFLVVLATMALVAGMGSTLPSAYAGGKIASDDGNKYIDLGMGMRTRFSMVEDGSASGGQYSNTFGVDNARIYINGKIHKFVGFEFNTECFNCNNSNNAGAGTVGLLDAIGKFEITEQVNVWFGRMLVPTERGELNGPFYHAVYDGFRTPLNQSDFSGGFGVGGAGKYGRDNGVTFFGKVHPGGTHVQYVAGVFTGLQSAAGVGPNQRDSLKYAGRLTWNLLNEEKNPGYYTSGTYYGTAGDILAIAVGGEYQNAGAGSFANKSAFGSVVTDLLFEKVLPDNNGVVTVNAEYKRYWAENLAAWNQSGTGGDCFCMFSGTSVTGYALYLFPNEIGIGRFQPYGRYTYVNSVFSNALDEFELGTNYIISGHNARISTYWRTGNLSTNGGFLGASPLVGTGQHQDSFNVALQLQY